MPTHWLAANEREWSNAHVIFADTETRTVAQGDDLRLELRCWAARTLDRRELRKSRPADRSADGLEAADFAAWVDEQTAGRKATWLYTHNLGFDLTVSRLVDRLAAMGWTLGMWSLADRATWLRLHRGHRGLALVDSTTWLPVALEEVGEAVGLAKLPLPDDDAPDTVWLERCRRDVEILSAGMLELMDWWDAQRLGNWSVTGTTCGWNAMRHRIPHRTVLVRRNDGGESFERSGIYAGRRDATRWGEVPGGPFVTVDFEDTYPRICAELRLPAKRLAPFDCLPLDDPKIGDGAVQAMARAVVSTDMPRYPLRWAKTVWYPVGTFETVLAGPELAAARDRGDLVEVKDGYGYWCDGHLAGWASWVLDLQHGRVAGAPRVASIPARRWGRSVPGRFAQRVASVEHLGPALSAGWSSRPGVNVTTGAQIQVVDLAGEQYLLTRDTDADDCFPAVLAWVESHCRLRLGRMLDALGEGAWLACNTDGAVVDVPRAASRLSVPWSGRGGAKGAGRALGALCDRLAAVTAPLVPRPKRTVSDLTIAGPQTMLLDGRPSYAGVPRAATDDGAGGLEAHLWPGLEWQMTHGDRSGFVRPLARYSVPAVTVHRWALADGGTEPVIAGPGADGATRLYPTNRTVGPGPFGWLASEQSRAVRRLLS